jgi:hypothetical protein
MIDQGTDGLSRGVWVTPMNQQPWTGPGTFTSAVFAPLTPDADLVEYIKHEFSIPGPWRYQPWDVVWDGRDLFGELSVWFPPPELARQCLSFHLETWVEQPYITSGLFFVPRTLSGFWHGLSRHVVELCELKPTEFPFQFPPLLPIPIVVLYIPPFVPTLPDTCSSTIRMDAPPSAKLVRWHKEQAELMRGLPPRDLRP